jgi:hypothetical protein
MSDSNSQSPPSPKMVKCPQCRNLIVYSIENPFRPFCSERCRLIDLGEWASEGYRIPTQGTPESNNSIYQDEESDDDGDPLQ